MGSNLARKLIADHLVDGTMNPGEEIGLAVDQTLTQDATGTLVMLELEAMELDRARTELSAQYVDHNLLQTDYRNPDDHRFLRSACNRFGAWFSPPGNGVSHPVHMERFGAPGKSLLGSDSHTPAAGSMGMLAMGAGGLEVALAMAGRPYYTRMPKVVGVRLEGVLPDWVSAKDVVLEMLRRWGVRGGRGRIFEYHGPGLAGLSAMDRHVIANMGTELGATTTVFPADEAVRAFLHSQGRSADFRELQPDPDCTYDEEEVIDLGGLEPLIAYPSSPGNVVRVAEVAGAPIYQAMIGSSANPGLRDFAVPALMVDGRHVDPGVSFDINPTSRQITENLMAMGLLGKLLHAGGRIHQPGCNGCIGMGQAPSTRGISLRTVPRNFPGRSGTADDRVYLCSPETATASALTGRITDPRELNATYPPFREPEGLILNTSMLEAPPEQTAPFPLVKGPNIASLPELEPLPDPLEGPVLLKVGDNISTDEILPAGTEVLPYRSNIPAISSFVFRYTDPGYPDRAFGFRQEGHPHFLVAGENYGQGSSREHAALAPRYLGLRAVVAKSFARIHEENLANFGILPLVFTDPANYDRIRQGDLLRLQEAPEALGGGEAVGLVNRTRDESYRLRHDLSPRQADMIQQGSLINLVREGEPGRG
ncbi:aconitate hydratase [Thiohalorhabdus denitrificans]|uniref:Aconitase n=1 Tax=Thiohalorhabdus denitrificans TaxID=381306 RepID=A0A0P9EPU9_9GAMM|nr:aconitate hydratase [Thiohalorhabdus denitrificans]KPV40520.1 aconitate hydratase [Thiohalorhabdus denitrificans]SCY62222.1 aconitase [Thiohalorhabdus denitrificans]